MRNEKSLHHTVSGTAYNMRGRRNSICARRSMGHRYRFPSSLYRFTVFGACAYDMVIQ